MYAVPSPSERYRQSERSRVPVQRKVNEIRGVVERFELPTSPAVDDALATLLAWAQKTPVRKSAALAADECAPLETVQEVLPTRQRNAMKRVARLVDRIDTEMCENHKCLEEAPEVALKALCRWTDNYRLLEIGAVQEL